MLEFLSFQFFLYYWILTDEIIINKLIKIIFFTIIFVSIDTLIQYTNYNPEFGFGKDIFGFTSDFYGRLTGPFYKELVPGAYISKFALIGLIYLLINFKNKKKFQSILITSYLSLAGAVCYVSGERMALATFLLGLVLLIIFFKKYRLNFLISFILIILISIILNKSHPIYNDYKVLESTPLHLGLKIEKQIKCDDGVNNCNKIIKLQPSFFQIIKNFDKSAYGEIYNLGLKMWKDHPFKGIGLNNFNYLCKNDERYKDLIINFSCVTHPHNFYLQWLVETGIFGLFIFIVYVFILLFFIKKNNSETQYISLSVLLILFWPIMSTGSLLKNWMGISTFFIIGICLSLDKIKQKI